MFTDKIIFPEELLPCKIGETVYKINKIIKTFKPKTFKYEVELFDIKTCEGFIIDYSYGEIRIRPAYDTWDGWCPILDNGYGYYTSKEEALGKVKELNELEEFNEQNKWIENL